MFSNLESNLHQLAHSLHERTKNFFLANHVQVYIFTKVLIKKSRRREAHSFRLE